MNSSDQRFSQTMKKLQGNQQIGLEEFLACVEFLVSQKQLTTLIGLISRSQQLIVKLVSPGLQSCKGEVTTIRIKNQRKIKSLPQFMYEHISQTFYSLAEAIQENDKKLIEAEILQITESIKAYRQDKGNYREYKSYVEYILEQNYLPKQKLDKIIDRNNKIIQNSKGKPSQGPKVIDYQTQKKMTQEFISGKLANFLASFSQHEKQWREQISTNPMLKHFKQENEDKNLNSQEALLLSLQHLLLNSKI